MIKHTVTFTPYFKSDEEYQKWYNKFIETRFKDNEQFLIIETKSGTYLIDKNDIKEIKNDNL